MCERHGAEFRTETCASLGYVPFEDFFTTLSVISGLRPYPPRCIEKVGNLSDRGMFPGS